MPERFLIENVVGLLGYPLLGVLKEGGRSLEGGHRGGFVKLILQISMHLGYVLASLCLLTHGLLQRYQIQMSLLQAAAYGVPQSRERVIFVGTKRGLTMPSFPLPTHTFKSQSKQLGGVKYFDGKKMIQERLYTPSRAQWEGDEVAEASAPCPTVTIDRAMGDLVSDW